MKYSAITAISWGITSHPKPTGRTSGDELFEMNSKDEIGKSVHLN
jgi:hypothetical protein